jgi:hypothetical protein
LWWPLALSWLMMGVELPLVSAIIARTANPEPSLAALSSLIYPIALMVEAPIIMLLAASTALCTDWASYQKLRRFTHVSGLLLTLLHVVIAFTPLYDLIAESVVNVHPSVVEPGRVGLQIMTPWTWAIASRRFQQGVLIRFERSRAVVEGTLIRLSTVALVLAVGISTVPMSGIAFGTLAIAAGVIAEAGYASFRTRAVLRDRVRPAAVDPNPLTWRHFYHFYLPLALTPMMTLILQPMGAAAMNRMPEKMASTATWSSVYGLVFMFRSAGFAFNEVVVTLIAAPDGVRVLRRIAWIMACLMVGLLTALAFTPLGGLWFGEAANLSPALTAVAVQALVFAVLMPGYSVLQSFYQGALVHSRKTRGVTEAVALYLLISTALLVAGIVWGHFRGIEFVLVTFTVAGLLQTVWLGYRSRVVLRALSR